MKTTQKGFTLIELMIVIAIIAILAAIAIPQYQKYITKSQFSEAPSVAAGMETDIQLYWMQNGTCPTTTDSTSYKGKYIASASITDGTATGADATPTCDIILKFASNSVSSGLKTQTVTFKGTKTGKVFNWVCTSSADPEYVPQTCRG